MNIDNLTVLILSAGFGRRMGHFSRMINKGLIPYQDKPLLSHIIDKFPTTTKFVIACGYHGSQIKNYVSNVHHDKNIVFVDIPDFSEGNTGPATTVQYCREHIKNGFMLITCDTLFEFNWKDRLNHSWIGVYPVDSHLAKDYDWVERDGNDIVHIHNKKPSVKAVDAFIGLLYDKDGQFLQNLIDKKAKENFQGFEGVDFKAETVYKWLDFGTYDKWKELANELEENSFSKPNEIFYHDNSKVVKFFSDKSNARLRVKRANENSYCMPENIKAVDNFLIHDWVKGDIVYNQYTPDLFRKMLSWCENKLWITQHFNKAESVCYDFYYKKTQSRLNQLKAKYSDWSEPITVNGLFVKSINDYINDIDYNWLCTTTEWRFIHGDLHFDNMIYDTATDKFTAIDWRTDFGGELYGDLYYDLAKLLGGLHLNYKEVKKNNFTYAEQNNSSTIDYPSVDSLEEYVSILKDWVLTNNLDWKKVETLVPLIYLNMSPLHDAPFDKFLVSLALLHFSKLGK